MHGSHVRALSDKAHETISAFTGNISFGMEPICVVRYNSRTTAVCPRHTPIDFHNRTLYDMGVP